MSSDDATPAEATPPAEDAADDPAPEEEEPEEPLPMECDATLVFAFRARAPPRPIAAPRASVVPAEETSDDHEKADASGGDAPATTTTTTEPTPEAEAAASEDDPVTSSMTITWTLPDGATATTPHPLVLERRDAGVVDVDFVSASAMIRVDEAKLRAIAATPFVAVTFTRVDEARRTPEEAGEEAAGEAVDDAPAADAPGPTTTTYSVTLGVSGVILGVRAFERLTFTTSDARVRETVTDDDYALLPPILAGYADASFELRYAGDGTSPPEPEPAPEAEAEAEASDAAAPLPPPPPPTFIPSGLAREMAPFAVTLRSIDRLPDAPASAAALTEKCEPVTAHWRFASGVLPVVSLEATSSSGWSEPMAGTYPPIRTRGAEFGVPTMLFGMDMAGWSEGECDVYRTCATSVLEVRVHDRVKMEDKEATAAMAAFLGRGKGRKKKKKKKPEGEEGEEEAEEEEEEAAEGEDADGDKPPDDADAAADADARADEEAPAGDGFPAADVYGLATFDLRALCHPPHVARALSGAFSSRRSPYDRVGAVNADP